MPDWLASLPHPVAPQGVEPWWYFTAMALAVLVIGVAKAGFGGGIGILAVPLTANALPPDRAIGVMLPILIVGDIFSNLHYVKQQSWPHLRWLVSGGVVGIAIGTVVLAMVTDPKYLATVLSLLVGVICLAMVLLQIVRLLGYEALRIPPGAWGGRATGVVSGFVSTLAHSAGPVASIYMLEQKLDKRLHVGTLVLAFFMLNVLKLPTYVWLELVTLDRLIEGAWFLPLVPVGTVFGYWMHKRIPEKPFSAIVYAGAALAAGHLVWKALA